MRKLLDHLINTNGMTLPPPSLVNISRLSSPTPSPDPSTVQEILKQRPFFLFPSVPFDDDAFDLATLSLISGLVFLSVISFSFILHLCLRSRRLHHLQNFNSIWTTRLLLVTFASLWALNEVLRLSYFRRKYLYPFLPPLTLNQQANLCKVHVVCSFGFFQPGFLVTLLFLVNIAIQKRNPRCIWALASVCIICCPLLILQIFFVFFSPLEAILPKFMHTSFVLSSDIYGNETVLCTYPLFSCIIFGAFAIAYSLGFLLTCWRVASFVINKSIRTRINVLSFTVMIALPVQILCIGISPLWFPQDPIHGCVALVMFLAVACCVVVGEVILVIRPIADALAAGGDHCQSQEGRRLTGIESSSNEPKTMISS